MGVLRGGVVWILVGGDQRGNASRGLDSIAPCCDISGGVQGCTNSGSPIQTYRGGGAVHAYGRGGTTEGTSRGIVLSNIAARAGDGIVEWGGVVAGGGVT